MGCANGDIGRRFHGEIQDGDIGADKNFQDDGGSCG